MIMHVFTVLNKIHSNPTVLRRLNLKQCCDVGGKSKYCITDFGVAKRMWGCMEI
jgi:hypothetical protein